MLLVASTFMPSSHHQRTRTHSEASVYRWATVVSISALIWLSPRKTGFRYSLSWLSAKGHQLPFRRPTGSFPIQTMWGSRVVGFGQEKPQTGMTAVGDSQAVSLLIVSGQDRWKTSWKFCPQKQTTWAVGLGFLFACLTPKVGGRRGRREKWGCGLEFRELLNLTTFMGVNLRAH